MGMDAHSGINLRMEVGQFDSLFTAGKVDPDAHHLENPGLLGALQHGCEISGKFGKVEVGMRVN